MIDLEKLPAAVRKKFLERSAQKLAEDEALEAELAQGAGRADLIRRGVIGPESITQETHWELLRALAAFRAERERQGLSLRDLAERLGTEHGNLSRFETGNQPNPTFDTLQRHAQALGLRLGLVLSAGEAAAPTPPAAEPRAAAGGRRPAPKRRRPAARAAAK